nr:hypothetical protein [uncultured Agathobacter sp.]
MPNSVFIKFSSKNADILEKLDKKLRKGEMDMKNNLELILLVGNWVVVAIQAFTIFLYGNSIGLFIIMLLALIVQVLGVYDNRKK